MPDNIGNKAVHDYHLDTPPVQEGFFLKGASGGDWGMKNRLARLFNPESGNAVMLAFDHGYIMGPTAGLERIDLVIPPLIPYVDVLMGTKGILRSCISPASRVAKCVRVTYDTTVLFDEMSNGGGIACDIENAIRMNADCMAVQTFIGAPGGIPLAGSALPHRRRRRPVRHPHPGCGGRGQADGAHRKVLPAGHPCSGRKRREHREKLLLRGL